jgi:DNA repair ATPase RecN
MMIETTPGANGRGSVPEFKSTNNFDGRSAAEAIQSSISEVRDSAESLSTDIRAQREALKDVQGVEARTKEDVMKRDSEFLSLVSGPHTTYMRDPYSLDTVDPLEGFSQTERIQLATNKIAEIKKRYEPSPEGEAEMKKAVTEMMPKTQKRLETREGHEARAKQLMLDMAQFAEDLSDAGVSGGDAWKRALIPLRGQYGWVDRKDN